MPVNDLVNPTIESIQLLSSQNIQVFTRINCLALQIVYEASTAEIADMTKDQCRKPKTSGPALGIQAGYFMASQMPLAAQL